MRADEALDALLVVQSELEAIEDRRAAIITERDEAIARVRRTGTPATEIARALGVTRPVIYRALSRRGLTE